MKTETKGGEQMKYIIMALLICLLIVSNNDTFNRPNIPQILTLEEVGIQPMEINTLKSPPEFNRPNIPQILTLEEAGII